MAGRDAIEALIKDAYEARHRGDLDGLMTFFHPECSYRMVGAPSAPETFVEPGGRDAVRAQMEAFIQTFVFNEIEAIAMLVDGDRATLHWRAEATCLPTGRKAAFEIMDLITVQDGRILELIQFTDTAGIVGLMQPA